MRATSKYLNGTSSSCRLDTVKESQGCTYRQCEERGEEHMLRALIGLFVDEEGQTMAEYGLILALIAIIVIAALGLLGGKIRDMFTKVGDNLT